MTTTIQNILETPDIYKYLQGNEDLLIEIFANPELRLGLHKRLYKEYKDDPKYIECSTKYKTLYKPLISNNLEIYFKLTTYNNVSRKFEYNTGLNVDSNEFKPNGCCSGGGLYFCKLENLYQFVGYGDYLTPIIIPKDIPVYQESHTKTCKCRDSNYIKLKAPCVFTLPRFRIDNNKINNFLSKYSHNNLFFKDFILYKSNNLDELNYFKKKIINTIGNTLSLLHLWYDEYVSASLKTDILLSLDNSLEKISKLKIIDKFILDYAINRGFPNQLEKEKNCIYQIKKLNLESEKYLKYFLDKEIETFSKFKCVVAGSNVLRYICNKLFKPNDIDLYMNINDYNEFINTNHFIINDDNKNKYSIYNMKNILRVTEISTPCQIIDQYGYPKSVWKKYQLIVVDIDPAQFIKENFDFDLCAIGFDFASKTFVNLVDKPDYSVLSIQPSYINKMTGTQIDSYSKYRASKTIGRIDKYLYRGFQVENWKEFLIEVRDKICEF